MRRRILVSGNGIYHLANKIAKFCHKNQMPFVCHLSDGYF
jgi:hypothetical protein